MHIFIYSYYSDRRSSYLLTLSSSYLRLINLKSGINRKPKPDKYVYSVFLRNRYPEKNYTRFQPFNSEFGVKIKIKFKI